MTPFHCVDLDVCRDVDIAHVIFPYDREKAVHCQTVRDAVY